MGDPLTVHDNHLGFDTEALPSGGKQREFPERKEPGDIGERNRVDGASHFHDFQFRPPANDDGGEPDIGPFLVGAISPTDQHPFPWRGKGRFTDP